MRVTLDGGICELIINFKRCLTHLPSCYTSRKSRALSKILDLSLSLSQKHKPLKKVKVKVTLEQTTKAQRGNRGVALLFL